MNDQLNIGDICWTSEGVYCNKRHSFYQIISKTPTGKLRAGLLITNTEKEIRSCQYIETVIKPTDKLELDTKRKPEITLLTNIGNADNPCWSNRNRTYSKYDENATYMDVIDLGM